MKHCEQCNLNVDNPMERCPLCYSSLTQLNTEPEIISYPDLVEQAEKYNILYRILLFLSITVGGSCLTINLLTYNQSWWSFIVIANIFYMWVTIGTAIHKVSRIGFSILTQAISLAVLLIIIDYFAGNNHWAFNYAVPLLFVTAMVSITIIIIVKRVAIARFILYFFLVAFLGFIPIILLAFDIVTIAWPSIASACYSTISLVSIFVFANNATKIELKKRFHI